MREEELSETAKKLLEQAEKVWHSEPEILAEYYADLAFLDDDKWS